MEAYSFFDERRKKARERTRRRDEWLKARRFQFKRMSAELRPVAPWGSQPESFAARIFNLDLRPERASLFCTTRVPPGQEVEFTILADDGKFYLRGTVESCQRLHFSSSVHSGDDFQYRISIRFKYRTRDEYDLAQERIAQFVDRHVRCGNA